MTPYGPVIVSRGVLDEPAYFNDSDERGLFQDYQMEVYFERAPGETVPFYTIWEWRWSMQVLLTLILKRSSPSCSMVSKTGIKTVKTFVPIEIGTKKTAGDKHCASAQMI